MLTETFSSLFSVNLFQEEEQLEGMIWRVDKLLTNRWEPKTWSKLDKKKFNLSMTLNN
jgi:hypothetical protein